MAFLKLGSKSESFRLEGQSWICTSGLQSDVIIEVGEMSFYLHKFPLLSRSGLIKKLIAEFPNEDGSQACVFQFHDVPGGAKTFELVTKFCYGVKIEITALNVVSLRCAAEYLQMTENYGEGNLISQTEALLEEVLSNWPDSIKALETCEEVQSYAEELHIVSRCIDSLAMKACSDPSLFNWPMAGRSSTHSPEGAMLWNGISSETKHPTLGETWWRFLPLMNRQSSFNDANHHNPGTTISTTSEADQRALLEEIVNLLPNKRGLTSSKNLLRLLRTAMILHASPSCREHLEKRVGYQLDQAMLVDLLIPNMGYSVETLYDVDCIQRVLDHFLSLYQPSSVSASPCVIEEGPLTGETDALTPMTMVANLVDGYLAEVAPDVNLKLPKFQALAAAIPDYARSISDGLYHAIDVYLKTHPWLTDSEREQICRLMNCQKLSLEASTHAAQNERLPLRVVVQVLFFEQLRLRTSISGWFFVSENLENSQTTSGPLGLPKSNGTRQLDTALDAESMRERVSELAKECSSIKNELQKLAKTKKSWSLFPKRLGFRRKSECCNPKEPNGCDAMEPEPSVNAKINENILS
ncbi:hypothetical protein QN277_012971 [Acacia crassicarpa]|uniref:Uncharacterized protein n=1 Tax=Acacia crassicarpa TaxID=499986 RepID=A0AAE1N2C0_9FABA|nr:hypothetical protein QN277_012971 [Acacia crassicarpa]